LTQTQQKLVQRSSLYFAWVVGSLVFFWRPIETLTVYALGNENISYVLLIPFLCGWLLFVRREQIFSGMSYDPAAALIPFIVAIGAAFWSLRSSNPGMLTGYAVTLALLWVSGFILIFGRDCLKKARFSMWFLLLMIPLPEAVLHHVVYFLQKGSAEIAAGLFDLTGVPVLREGFVFRLPRVTIEVAQECSGIRSSMALLVLALLVSHLYLRKFWKQTVFVVCGMIVMIVKNGIRIVTLTLLASYVDPEFMYGDLHRKGGIVFFLVGLLILLPILLALRKGEFAGQIGGEPIAPPNPG
jgi:exosortase